MNPLAVLFHRSFADSRSDGALLAAFLAERDEPAFAELVRRHGPLVWGVCRRALADTSDAEDAFQATFLVLARRARGLTASPTVGPWLHKVASQTARNARRKTARRLALFAVMPEVVPDPRPERQPVDLDAVLLGLPERCRAAILLCHIEGLTHREAAERLGCAEGTVSSLLSRGLAKLRARFPEPAAVLSVAAVVVPTPVANATVRSVVALGLASLSTTPPAVAALTREVLRMFWVKKTTAAGLAAVLLAAVGFGAGETVRQGRVAAGQEPSPTKADGQEPSPVKATGPGHGSGDTRPAGEKKVLSPEQIFRDNVVGEARVEFTVGAVSLGTSPFILEEAVDRPRVQAADGKFAVRRLQVILSEKVEARLRQLGIKDLQAHFYKKTVRVAGKVKQQVDAGDNGNRLVTYSLTVEKLDQLEFVGDPAVDKNPPGPGTPGGR